MFSRRDEIQNFGGKNGSLSETVSDIEVRTAHDWEYYHTRKTVKDDGTESFFWRSHTITVLIIISAFLVYVALFEPVSTDSSYNTKRGCVAMCVMFIVFGMLQTSDGPFRRPHPVVWRFCFSVSLLYELALIFILFQSADDARQLLKHVDPRLGVQLPEKDYGGNCLLYDVEHEDPYHNIWDKIDGFVPTHFFGWWLKTLILRDWWLCMVISIMFEILEYTLEHQLPNFSECWWDHWIMDALLCNGLGIFLGMITLKYLNMKPYHWRGLWTIPTYTGRLKRVVSQFTPYSWMEFDWRPLSSLSRWMATLMLISVFLLAELNTFYLKYVLWVPPTNNLNLIRLIFFLLCGGVAMRETFEYMDNPNCKKLGKQAWVVLIIIITELLIVMKFDFYVITIPLPRRVAMAWILFVVGILLWTVWEFFYRHREKMRLGWGRSAHGSSNNLVETTGNLPEHTADLDDEAATMSFRLRDLRSKEDLHAKDKYI